MIPLSMRKLIPAVLARDPSIEVVGTAMDGAFALKKIEELHPDVVTLDLEMPRMDGMETLRLIMRRAPMPVVLFSTHSKEGGYATLKALALGAIDFVQKPQDAAAGHLESVADQLIEKIKVAKRAAGRKLPGCRRIRRSSQGEKEKSFGASPEPHHRHRHFHWRPERSAICSFADSCGFPGDHPHRSAHARRLYGNVREAPR